MSKFKQLVTKLEKKGDSSESAKKIAGAIGIKKYGPKIMAEKSAAGRKKSC